MANQDHLDILKQGVDKWNVWRKAHSDIRPDLCGADLRKANLYLADLHEADLHEADLDTAELRAANLSKADLRKANLRMAHLYKTNFIEADLTGAVLRGADLVRAQLMAAKLCGTDLRWVKLSQADLSHADLTGSSIYAISAWDVKLDGALQSNLIITEDGTSTITVDNLEVAQFIHMLVKYEKLRDVLNSIMQKGVLILGRFGVKDGEKGIELLYAIATQLRERQYLPIIFDFDRPENRDYTETVKTLVGLSRFVIADLTGSSVPHELQATVPHFDVPFVPIIKAGNKPYSLSRDFTKYPWVLPLVTFNDQEHLMIVMDSEIVKPAEQRFQERRQWLEQVNSREQG